MTNRLLERQVSLIDYLTSGAAIFGAANDAALPAALQGLDRRLLHLEARFSYEKRMEKIAGVFATTFALLADEQDRIFRDFITACPPADISRLANARQFYDFVLVHWQAAPPRPPYLPDVAACELACATIRAEPVDPPIEGGDETGRGPGIRRCRRVVLRRCAYDIRTIFEDGLGETAPVQRDTPLAIAMPNRMDRPRVFEVADVVFDLLTALDDWTDPAAFGDTAQLRELIRELAEHGLIEVRP